MRLNLCWSPTFPTTKTDFPEAGLKRQRDAVPRRECLCKGPTSLHGRAHNVIPGCELPDGIPHLCPARFTERIIDSVPPIAAPSDRLAVADQIDACFLDSFPHVIGLVSRLAAAPSAGILVVQAPSH